MEIPLGILTFDRNVHKSIFFHYQTPKHRMWNSNRFCLSIKVVYCEKVILLVERWNSPANENNRLLRWNLWTEKQCVCVWISWKLIDVNEIVYIRRKATSIISPINNRRLHMAVYWWQRVWREEVLSEAWKSRRPIALERITHEKYLSLRRLDGTAGWFLRTR